MNFIIVQGNPVDGFNYYGPFSTREEAIAKAEAECEGDWWVAMLSDL